MKRILLATVAMTALTSAGALAADLPARMPVKAAPYMAAYNWTGAYIGLNVGGAFGRVAGSDTSGVTGGGQIGYNWQAPGSPWVWGLEADFNGSSQDNSSTFGAFTGSGSIPYFGTVRGRLGYAWDRAMIYATGGLAYQNTKFDVVGPAGFVGSTNDTKTGYAVGGGVEWALWDRWTAKVEYLYLDTGNNGVATPIGVFGSRSTNNVVRTGLNYHF